MHYQVRFVSEHALPDGVTWAFVTQAGETYLFVKWSALDRSTGRCPALDRARAAWFAGIAAVAA